MIGAVHNREESVAFRARLSRPTIKAINNGFRDLSQRPNVSKEEIEQFMKQFNLMKKDLAATGESGTYMLKHNENNDVFIQFEATGKYRRANLPWAMQNEMIISNGIVKFPPNQLHRLAEIIKTINLEFIR